LPVEIIPAVNDCVDPLPCSLDFVSAHEQGGVSMDDIEQ